MCHGNIVSYKTKFYLYSEVSGDREVQRTMLELLNQLDGFSSDDQIKVHSLLLFSFSVFY